MQSVTSLPSSKLEYCLETTAKKILHRARQPHTDTSSYTSCSAVLQQSYLEKKGGLFCYVCPVPHPHPPSFAQNCLRAAEEACEQSDHPQSARHTPCPYSWAVYPVFPAVRKQVIQVQSLKLGCLPLTSQCKYYFISLTFKRNGKTFHPSNTWLRLTTGSTIGIFPLFNSAKEPGPHSTTLMSAWICPYQW